MTFAEKEFARGARTRLAAAVAVLAVLLTPALRGPAAAQAGPSAAGLWQKLEDGKPDGWFLIVDRDGSMFEGAIAKMFLRPG